MSEVNRIAHWMAERGVSLERLLELSGLDSKVIEARKEVRAVVDFLVSKGIKVIGHKKAGVDKDLRYRLGPIEPVLARIDPLLQTPIDLSGGEFEALSAFVRNALLDERATRQNLCPLIPDSVPSGYPTMIFEECH